MRTVRLGDRSPRPSVDKPSEESEPSLSDLALVHLTHALENPPSNVTSGSRESPLSQDEDLGLSSQAVFF